MNSRPHRPTAFKVLQVVDNLGVGGAETWLIEILRLWSKTSAGRMDFLITGRSNGGAFEREAESLGARIHRVRYSRRNLLEFSRQFRRILREGEYDAVHDHADFSSGWHFALGACSLPLIRITHVHNPSYQIRHNYGVTMARRLTSRLGRLLVSRYSTHITGTSRQMLVEYGFHAARYEHIPKAALYCGFDPSRFSGDHHSCRAAVRSELGWPDDSVIVLVAGRMDQSPELFHPQNHKNSAFAVSVGLACIRRDRRVHVLFAGQLSPAVDVLLARVEKAGFLDHFRFMGVRTDIARLMLASDALLFPSREEGLGMVAVEAQAAGLPVLASTGVPRECVVVPELVRFRDVSESPELWSADLLELIAQPRNAAAANALVAASSFAIDRSAAALARLYSQGLVA